MAAKSISDLRKELGAYLTKPMEVGAGSMSTQVSINATSLTSGGLVGEVVLKANARIASYDADNKRVKLGDIS